jgi:methylenetetrahydrofolate reductase (NADPH)
MTEEVRPINWANRPKSYIKRTVGWDEFPNGRWGDNRSPAYGELSDSHFFRPVEGKKEDLLAMWGEAPVMPRDVYEIFALYILGKIPIIPWCESSLQSETISISNPLAEINRAGFLTINSQPAVNGEKSDHPVFGWGGPCGRVYQKAYVEFFCSPLHVEAIVKVLNQHSNYNFYAIDSHGTEYSSGYKTVTALTWGVFPNKEILQPTVFDHESFVVWSKEAFQLWIECWASLYDDDSESAELLYNVSTIILFCSLSY